MISLKNCKSKNIQNASKYFLKNTSNHDFNIFDNSTLTKENLVHIRVQQRKGRKCITTVQGLKEANLKQLLQSLKKELCCNGSIIDEDKSQIVLQLQGDQREGIEKHLIKKG